MQCVIPNKSQSLLAKLEYSGSVNACLFSTPERIITSGFLVVKFERQTWNILLVFMTNNYHLFTWKLKPNKKRKTTKTIKSFLLRCLIDNDNDCKWFLVKRVGYAKQMKLSSASRSHVQSTTNNSDKTMQKNKVADA